MNQFLLLLMAGLKEASYHIYKLLCPPIYLELSSIKKFQNLPIFAEIGASSENCFFGNKTQVTSKRALKDFRSLFYQIDHIWGASHGLKKSPKMIFLEK